MTRTRQQRRRQIQTGLRSVQQHVLIPAEVGKLETDGTYTVYQDSSRNTIYARLTDDDNKLVQAYNLRIKPKAKGAIWLQETIDGYEVAGLRAKRSTELYGNAAPGMNVPDVPGEFMNTVIPARNYLPGFVRLAAATGLTVQVEPFWYRYYGLWTRWPGGTVDLGDYLPATTDYWHWAMIGIWPYDNSVKVVTGTETASVTALTDSTLDDLGVAIEGLVPCDAVKLQEGMTSLHVDYFQHGRLNAAEIDVGGFPDEIASAYYHIPVGRKVVWPAPLTISGTLTIEGTLLIR